MNEIATRRRSVLIAPGSDTRKARQALAWTVRTPSPPANKEQARDLVRRLVTETDREGSVSFRVNGHGTTSPRARHCPAWRASCSRRPRPHGTSRSSMRR